jgi:hypothetical protein
MAPEATDSIQVFCPICARGVLIRNESMYKCPRCERVVCRPCFNKEHRLCVECCDPQTKGRPRSTSPIPALSDPDDPHPAQPVRLPRDRTRQGIALFVTGIAALVAVVVLGQFVTLPNWLTALIVCAACISFTLGIVQLLKD